MTDTNDPLAPLLDVPVRVSAELGRRTLPLAEVSRMGPGSVIELGKSAGESLDIRVNGKLVARGEAVVVGERYGIRIIEVVGAEPSAEDDATPQAPKENEHAA